MNHKNIGCVVLLTLTFGAVGAESLTVPAFTAYIEPDPNGLRVSEKDGVRNWNDARHRVVWHGLIKTVGKLEIALELRLPETKSAEYKLTVGEKQLSAKAEGVSEKSTSLSFGTVDITAPGYHRFALEGVAKDGKTFGELGALVLSGPAVEGAHFNLKPRRNAASVHLGYPVPKEVGDVEWFYNEVTVRTDPIWTFYMACGFHRGYFGIQVNSPTERRIIFSVWDSGNEGVDRKKVAAEDRVQLLAKGENVVAHDFGNEGTGGHSHQVYPWKTGDTYRFLLAAKPDGKHTSYSGYFFFPETQKWGLIATFRAPKDGGTLKGLYSFNENFEGKNGDLRRLAEFGNQWVKNSKGEWTELLAARFTHDVTGQKDRHDYGAGVTEKGVFYLSNGGFVADPIKAGQEFKRPAKEKQPEIALP